MQRNYHRAADEIISLFLCMEKEFNVERKIYETRNYTNVSRGPYFLQTHRNNYVRIFTILRKMERLLQVTFFNIFIVLDRTHAQKIPPNLKNESV